MASGQFCEIRYEELVRSPVAQMRRMYEELQLGDFEAVRPAIENYLAGKKDYKTNRYEMAPELQGEITRRWADYIKRYGYAKEPTLNRPSAGSEKAEKPAVAAR